MHKLLLLTAITGLFCLPVMPVYGEEWKEVGPGNAVELPSHFFHQKKYRVQWWYFTGHLYDEAGREFGYELTFFAAGVQLRPYRSRFGINTIYFSHFAISDVAGNKFHHYSNSDAGAFGFTGADDRRLHVWVDKASLEGTSERMHIKAEAEATAIDLILVPSKRVILNGDRGYSRKSEESPLIASLYFSFTDLQTSGMLKLGDQLFAVKGKSWFDREISSRGLTKNETGWDWFSLQLDDGREIMLYIIREKNGTTGAYSSGTFVQKDGSYRHLTAADFRVDVKSRHTSGETGTDYPSKWEVFIPSEKLKLLITPLVAEQEFPAGEAMGNAYWEGTCRIEGNAKGRAYVEMTGYQKTN